MTRITVHVGQVPHWKINAAMSATQAGKTLSINDRNVVEKGIDARGNWKARIIDRDDCIRLTPEFMSPEIMPMKMIPIKRNPIKFSIPREVLSRIPKRNP